MMVEVNIKICGIRSADMALHAAAEGAQAIGLVFVPQSPRAVSIAEARTIAQAIAGRVEMVGVFRDESPGQIEQIAGQLGLSRVQLHGRSRAHAAELFPRPVVYAVTFDEQAGEHLAAAQSAGNIVAVLMDSPDTSALGGGTGRTFDWQALAELLERHPPHRPVIVAGGLTADNVGSAIRTVRPWGVDVSSGVESRRGVKDAARISAFCRAVRQATV